VSLRRRGRRLTVVVADGPRRTTSGLRRGSVRVSFGERDGAGASAARRQRMSARRRSGRKGRGTSRPITVRVVHTYSHAGRFELRVRARDKAGNVTLLRRSVGIG
jgi:hypothetical protein